MTGKNGGKGGTYRVAGVDIDAGNALVEAIKPLVRSTRRPGADAEIGGFGGVFDIKAAGYTDPLLVAANDGVGTKVKIAAETGIHDTVGIDLVAMCVNDLVVQGAEPLFFLDYFATGKLDPVAGAAIVKGIAEGCKQANCALIGGETAEMPGVYRGNDYDLAGFAVGAVERDGLLPKGVEAGDVVLGLASSGLHANGFSLVRKIVADAGLDWDAPCPFAYDESLGRALLTPTRIYVRALLRALGDGGIRAMAHITGGGFPENVPRVLPKGLAAEIELSSFSVLPVFDWLARMGDIGDQEMLRTFNCGIGMVVVVAADQADRIAALLKEEKQTVYRLGWIVPESASGKRVRFSGKLDLAR